MIEDSIRVVADSDPGLFELRDVVDQSDMMADVLVVAIAVVLAAVLGAAFVAVSL